MSSKKKKTPRTWTEEHFEVKPSTLPGAGMGLFTKVAIEPGDRIGDYTGKVLTDAQANSEPYVDSLYLVWICKDHWVLGEGEGSNYTRYINHCDVDPNAELRTHARWKKAWISARAYIDPGEELFFDYGDDYWDVCDQNKVDRDFS